MEYTRPPARRILRTLVKVIDEYELNRNGYYQNKKGQLEHREFYKSRHGKIPPKWIVHHIDMVKTNNDIENLIALPERFHTKMHVKMRDCGVVYERSYIESLLKTYKEPYTPTKKEKRLLNLLKRHPRLLKYIKNT